MVACADDITLVTHDESPTECARQMQEMLDIIHCWCNEHGLTINFNECDCAYFSNKIKKPFSLDHYPHLKLGQTLTYASRMK